MAHNAFLALLCGSVLLAGACDSQAAKSKAAATEPAVVLRAPGGQSGELRVLVELARTDEERQRGLMFRQSLAAGRGMLFLFDRPSPQKFWMKNTLIPLDMLFIDADHKVIFIEENAEPQTLNSRGPGYDQLTQYVLEVPGGWCRQNGVVVGVEARFVNVP